MTLPTFFGVFFTAYGPPLSMFFFTIAPDPVRIIILILSAFFWLLSLLISSLIWLGVSQATSEIAIGIFISVTFQELFRFLIYGLLKRAVNFMKKLTENENTKIFENKHILAYVVGFGFGLMSGVFSLVNVLADSVGPGTLGFSNESRHFFIISAFLTLAMILLHTFWGVVSFNALDEKRYLHLGFTVCSHYFISFLSLLNQQQLYGVTISFTYGILILTGSLAFFVSGGSINSIKSCFQHPLRHNVEF